MEIYYFLTGFLLVIVTFVLLYKFPSLLGDSDIFHNRDYDPISAVLTAVLILLIAPLAFPLVLLAEVYGV